MEGRGLSSRQTHDVVRDLEIGQPINSEECSETAEGVARESEGRSWLPLLRPVRQGHPEVVDADLADYFGSIPHCELLQSVARRIVDRRVLHLIKMWLECPVEETDDRGRKTRTTEARDNRRGILNPKIRRHVYASVYIRRFVL